MADKSEEFNDLEWHMSENLCDDCAKKMGGCLNRFDDDNCIETRRHFLGFMQHE
jgi:hypothetical protein